MSLLAAIGWKVLPRIEVGPLSVSPHGLGIAAGYLAGGTLTARRAERLYGIKRDHVWNALMWAVLGVIVGARLFFVAGHIDEYWPNVGDIFRVWEGGIVFYGGVFGGIAAAVPYLRRHGISFWDIMDATAPGFPLGIVIGRIGDLVIGDHLGGPTDLPFGYRYEGGDLPGCPAAPPAPCPQIGEVVHQTALYDLVSAAVLLPVVLRLGRHRRPPGVLIMTTAALYALGRLLADFGRSAPTYAGLRGTQWVSVALILAGATHLLRSARRPTAAVPEPAAAAPGPSEAPAGAPDLDELLADEMVAEGSPVDERAIWKADDSIDPGVS